MIKEVTKDTFDAWLDLCHALWPYYKRSNLEKELQKILKSEKETAFLYSNKDGENIGCINVSLRNDYVPGSTSNPTGYIEGVFVVEEYRNKGVAKQLLEYSYSWFTSKGCKEVASDAKLENKVSIKFHKALGFTGDDTLVHFIKSL